MSNLLHIVLIKFKDDTPQEAKDKIYDLYQKLGDDCGGKEAGILFWQVSHNLDPRKGVALVEVALFTSQEAFQAFRNHVKHQEIVALMREYADWQVGDIMVDSIPLA